MHGPGGGQYPGGARLERYKLNWPGKAQARREVQRTATAALIAAPAASVAGATTRHAIYWGRKPGGAARAATRLFWAGQGAVPRPAAYYWRRPVWVAPTTIRSNAAPASAAPGAAAMWMRSACFTTPTGLPAPWQLRGAVPAHRPPLSTAYHLAASLRQVG